MPRKWYRLDTAGLIFPAVRSRSWSNVFRVSLTIKEEIDPVILQKAVDELKDRFPSLYVRLRTGAFWYYLEECNGTPKVREDYAYPLSYMGFREVRNCCLRVFYFRNRLAVECFHVLTDGSGGSIYLQTLAARYLSLRYGNEIPAEHQILDYQDTPTAEELEDSFLKNTGIKGTSRREDTVYHLHGTEESDGFRYLTTGILSSEALLKKAHEYHCTVTVFLAGVMAEALIAMQDEELPRKRQRPVKVTIPVNMRKLYHSKTIRNFVLTLNLGVDPRNGDYTLQELCDIIKHQLLAEATPQGMAGRIAANVNPQMILPIRLAPLFIKNFVMGLVYADSGERKGCINISNLGQVVLPPSMMEHVERMEFIIGVQRTYPNNCSVVSVGDVTCINMIRSIEESEIERRFFSRLVDLGLEVSIESNEDIITV